jgi:hypothetical protein
VRVIWLIPVKVVVKSVKVPVATDALKLLLLAIAVPVGTQVLP